jgi:carbonic anhydrase
MKISAIALSIATVLLCLAASVSAEEKAHWNYDETGHGGPAHWGELSPEYTMCATGKNQSPINLTDMVESDLSFISINYKPGGNEVVNNGHAIQVNYEPGSSITVNGHEYELKQFHFHTPSENTINGNSWPMEAHFVHADKAGNLAVIALMFRTGEKNNELQKAWDLMPGNAGDKAALASNMDADKLLPEDRDYYRFNGSLTTPPCSEGVLWLVMKQDTYVSLEQFNTFADTMHHPNNRPVQPLNARLVLK